MVAHSGQQAAAQIKLTKTEAKYTQFEAMRRRYRLERDELRKKAENLEDELVQLRETLGEKTQIQASMEESLNYFQKLRDEINEIETNIAGRRATMSAIEVDIESRLRNILEEYVTLGVTPQGGQNPGEHLNVLGERPKKRKTKNRQPKDTEPPRGATLSETEWKTNTQTGSRGGHQELLRAGTLGGSWVEQIDAEQEEESQRTQVSYPVQDQPQHIERNQYIVRDEYQPKWNEKKETDKFVARQLNKLAATEEVSAILASHKNDPGDNTEHENRHREVLDARMELDWGELHNSHEPDEPAVRGHKNHP